MRNPNETEMPVHCVATGSLILCICLLRQNDHTRSISFDVFVAFSLHHYSHVTRLFNEIFTRTSTNCLLLS